MIKKVLLFFVIISLSLCTAIFISCSTTKDKIIGLNITMGSESVENKTEIQSENGTICLENWEKYDKDILNIIENLRKIQKSDVVKSNDVITEVEYILFEFNYKTKDTERLWVVYDYLLKKEYLIYKNELYEFISCDYLNTFIINPIITPLLSSNGDGRSYRFSNIHNHTFRFEKRHWKEDVPDSFFFEHYELDKFSNIEKSHIDNKDDAIKKGKEALQALNLNDQVYKTLWFYDKMYGYWMIEYCDFTNILHPENVTDIIFVVIDQDDNFIEVYFPQTTLYL